MAKTQTKTNGAARLVDPEELLTEEDFEFEDFLDELGPEISTVSIFRVLRDGSREHVDKVSLSELITDVYGWLREQCGIGKYQLYFRGADRRYRGAKTVTVGDRKPANGASTPAPAVAATTAHQEFMEKILFSMLATMKPPVPPDVGSLLQGLASIAPKPAPQPDATAMLTAVATVFATLRGPQKDEDWLQRAKTIIELAKDLQPDNGRDTVWSVVKDVGKEVVHRLGTGTPGAPGGPPDNPPAVGTRTIIPLKPSPSPATMERPADLALAADIVSPVVVPADSAPELPGNGKVAMNLPQNAADWLRVGLAYLKEKARLFKDPEIYIEMLFDNIEEPQWKAIVASIQEGATMENLLEFDPEIAQNEGLRNWFARLYDGVHSELFPKMDSARPRGNETHIVDHAGSRAAG